MVRIFLKLYIRQLKIFQPQLQIIIQSLKVSIDNVFFIKYILFKLFIINLNLFEIT